MKELIGLLLGNISPAFYVASYIFLIIGFITVTILDFGASAAKTKDKFSFSYWWEDNRIRLITNIVGGLVILLGFLRFWSQYSTIQLSLFVPYAIGVCIDGAIVVFRRFTNINFFNGIKQ